MPSARPFWPTRSLVPGLPGSPAARSNRPGGRAGRALPVALWVLAAAGCSPGGEPADAGPDAGLPPFTVIGRWGDPAAIRVTLDPARSPLPEAEFRAAVTRALDAWARTGTVGFQVGDHAEPELVLRWATGSDPEAVAFGRDTSVALTRNPGGPGPRGPGGEPGTHCEVLFDAERPWNDGELDLERAALHELGHALGLGHVEVAGSAMHPQRELAAARPGPGDRAGLRSLYGGGEDGPGDLEVRSGGALASVLRRVAPPGRAGWTLFDADGDGDDELLVWATEPGDGALTVYDFEPGGRGPRLARTAGPFLGVAGHGAVVVAWTGPDGARQLDVSWPDGSAVRRTLDRRGAPLPPPVQAPPGAAPNRAAEAAGSQPPPRAAGDLDGNGEPETVEGRG